MGPGVSSRLVAASPDGARRGTPLRTSCRPETAPTGGLVRLPFVDEFLAKKVDMHHESPEQLLAVEPMCCPVTPRRFATLVETLHENEGLHRVPARFERMKLETRQHLSDRFALPFVTHLPMMPRRTSAR